MERKPHGYWKKDSNIELEIRKYVEKFGPEAFANEKMKANGYGGLADAVTAKGIKYWRSKLSLPTPKAPPAGPMKPIDFEGKSFPSIKVGAEYYDVTRRVFERWLKAGKRLEAKKKPDGYYTDEKLEEIAWRVYEKEGDLTHTLLKKNGESKAGQMMSKSEKGFNYFKELVGAPLRMNTTRDDAIKMLQEFVKKKGIGSLNFATLAEDGEHSLIYVIVKYLGGLDAAKAAIGVETVSPMTLRALGDIRRIVADMGDQIHAMDQKSWLLILQAQKGIQNIGDRSNLAPVKLKMLRGEYQPEDYVPAEGEERSLVEQDLIDAANKAEQVQLDATEIDTIDEPEEQVLRLAKLSPAQIIKATSIAASVIDDESVVEQLVDHRIEKIWESLFRAHRDHREAMVSELKKEQTSNAYVTQSVKGFLAEWAAMRHLMDKGIQGIVKPEGGDLNLMQYREAALLQRDRARLNLSDMGAGKTLSAIAGMQLAGASRVLVLCPNNTIPSFIGQLGTFLPSASTAAKTWTPFFAPEEHPQWVVNNLEMLQDRYREDIAKFLEVFKPDALVIDEIHLCKTTNADNPSQRRSILGELCNWARQNSSIIYAMTGTPVVNKLGEAVDLFRMVQPGAAEGLGTRHTINNCLAVHNAIQPFVTRYVPRPFAEKVTRRIDVQADHLLEDAMSAGKNVINIDAALAEAKIDALVELAKEDGKLLVFTTPVTGVVDPVVEALASVGIKAVRHTGDDKFEDGSWTVRKFIEDPSVKVLVASTSTLSTGVDGLQAVCGRCVFLTLPWTPAEHDQAVARLVRQGTAFRQVEITTIFAHLQDPETGESWSLDEQKHDVLTSKRTVAAAVADGVSPTKDALAFSLNSVTKAWSEWRARLGA